MGSSTDVRALVRAVLGALLLTSAPVLAASAQRAASPATTRDDPANDNRWRVDRCQFGLSYHSLTKVTAAITGGVRRSFEPRSVCTYGAAHLGLGGTRASVGSAVTIGRFASALGVSGGVLRTFGAPAGDAVPWRTYVGGSVHLWPLLGIHSELGAYSLLTRRGEAGRRLVTWSVGIGY